MAQELIEHKDIAAISPMATFDAVDNRLTITLELDPDREFDPKVLKLTDGTQNYIYGLAVNQAPTPDVDVVTRLTVENEKLQQELEHLKAMPESSVKSVEVPQISEPVNVPPDVPEGSVSDVGASQSILQFKAPDGGDVSMSGDGSNNVNA